MRKITGQTIASTELDLHGEEISREALTSLFNQIPPLQLVNQDHDLSKPPIARMYNKQLVELEGGILAIKVDVDILDEKEFAKRGAFSISFAQTHYTINREREADIRLLFNSRIVDLADVAPLLSLSKSLHIDAVDLQQKGLENAAIIIIAFVSGAVAAGFFGQPGADAYNLLKAKLKELAQRYRNRNVELTYHFSFKARLGDDVVEVIIESDTERVQTICEQIIAIEPLLERVSQYANLTKPQRVTLQITQNLPYVQIARVIDHDGQVIDVHRQIDESR